MKRLFCNLTLPNINTIWLNTYEINIDGGFEVCLRKLVDFRNHIAKILWPKILALHLRKGLWYKQEGFGVCTSSVFSKNKSVQLNKKTLFKTTACWLPISANGICTTCLFLDHVEIENWVFFAIPSEWYAQVFAYFLCTVPWHLLKATARGMT